MVYVESRHLLGTSFGLAGQQWAPVNCWPSLGLDRLDPRGTDIFHAEHSGTFVL